MQYNTTYQQLLLQMVQQNPYGYYNQIRLAGQFKSLKQYITESTSFLDQYYPNGHVPIAVRVYYVCTNHDTVLTCCVCGKPYTKRGITVTESGFDPLTLHCCHQCAMNDQRTKDRIGDTFEAHFGVRSAFQAKEVKDKIAMTVLAKYGAPKYTQTERYHNQCSAQNTARLLSPEVVAKKNAGLLLKYGEHGPLSDPTIRLKVQHTRRELFYKNNISTSTFVEPLFDADTYIQYAADDHHRYDWRCEHCGFTFTSKLQHVKTGQFAGQYAKCPHCFPRVYGSASYSERVFADAVRQIFEPLGHKVYYKDPNGINHSVIGRKELDVYIPSMNLAFEYNGLWYHSIEFMRHKLDPIKNHHLEKTCACENIGVSLIHIWESEWMYHKSKVLSFIRSLATGEWRNNFTSLLIQLPRSKYPLTLVPDGYQLVSIVDPRTVIKHHSTSVFHVMDCGSVVYKKV